jgi:mRNA-degrading endonuclease RelE of RelBE toxin-antitoxin system
MSRLPKADASRVYAKAQVLKTFPACLGSDIKALENHRNDYRLRVGNYRILFDFDSEIRIISIEEVKKRDERTY